MNDHPTLRLLADTDPVNPADVAGQGDAPWAAVERERILATPRSGSAGGRPWYRPTPARAVGAVLAAGALGTVGALAVAPMLGGDDAEPLPPAAAEHVSVLDRPARAGDRPPEWIGNDIVFRDFRIVQDSARHVGDIGTRRLFVARHRDGGVCLIDAIPDAGNRTRAPGGMNCQPPQAMRASFLVHTVGRYIQPSGHTIVGVVPDGFTTVSSGARSTTVVDNTFVLRGVKRADPVVAEGPAGRRVESVRNNSVVGPSANAGGTRLPVAMLAADAPEGSRAKRINGVLYSVNIRRKVGDIAIHWRTLRGRTTARWGATGMVGVPWPTSRAPARLGVIWSRSPDRTTLAAVRGIVADGYTRVTIGNRTAPVRGNLVVLEDISFSAADGVQFAVFTGPAGTLRVPVMAIAMQYYARIRPPVSP